MKSSSISLLFLLVLGTGAPAQESSDSAKGEPVRIKAGDLTAVFTDNAAYAGHRAWYNGVAYLSHQADTSDLFEPPVAGLNFEHIYDGQKWWQPAAALFEPRSSYMSITRLSDISVQLHQPPSDLHKLESWTKFTLTAPHYIDMDFFCIPRAATFDRGYIGLFWASYINTTDEAEKATYYIGHNAGEDSPRWIKYLTPAHAVTGTVKYEKDERDPTFVEGFQRMLYNTFSDSVYSYPFYYGRRGNMVLILMFDQAGPVRFSHSPTSGSPVGPGTYPAWDFQYLIFDYQVGQRYGFKARAVYKPFVSPEDVISEYEKWSGRKVNLTE
ncbi:MAG: hypothetical protein A3F83_17115 [Candidatus Glassbacteria bacterium RIFCSPLOWO2_12_FULL_58_11]|uniref:Uncharacterized protein n=1 Tax=Candidatus Glassbacteria bacterium RIFCSPLOWO2_12_FULL_58_11 TaxID=1817867 RepID=A0A1F5YWY4_9BACT|nr:MAG: hypothetical protein A3F83_17115 [Candidatus Glassbacteria bacterium RIFCSPLOWO2_12_FULL_58_11]